MHKSFILIHLIYSSTRFEHYYAHLQEDKCIRTASDIITLFRWLFSTQSPKESDDTRCCTNTIVLLKMSMCLKQVQEYNKCIRIKNLCIKLGKKDYHYTTGWLLFKKFTVTWYLGLFKLARSQHLKQNEQTLNI